MNKCHETPFPKKVADHLKDFCIDLHRIKIFCVNVAASATFSICHKFEPGFPCLSHSLCLLCFDVPLFSVVSRVHLSLLIDFR